MEGPLVTLATGASRTRLLVTVGPDEVLRARLPHLDQVRNERAVRTVLEGLSLWLDQRLCVVLSADGWEDYYRLELADELGVGARSVHYAVEVVERRRQYRGTRLRGLGDFRALHQLALLAAPRRLT
jgi:hypothetical protein